MSRRPNAYNQSLQEAQRRAEATQQEQMTSSQQDSMMEIQQNGIPEKQNDSKTSKQETIKTAKQGLVKRTYYLESEAILALNEIQMSRFRETGVKPTSSEIINEAIKLLKQQSSEPA
jgi:hypothetical protein